MGIAADLRAERATHATMLAIDILSLYAPPRIGDKQTRSADTMLRFDALIPTGLPVGGIKDAMCRKLMIEDPDTTALGFLLDSDSAATKPVHTDSKPILTFVSFRDIQLPYVNDLSGRSLWDRTERVLKISSEQCGNNMYVRCIVLPTTSRNIYAKDQILDLPFHAGTDQLDTIPFSHLKKVIIKATAGKQLEPLQATTTWSADPSQYGSILLLPEMFRYPSLRTFNELLTAHFRTQDVLATIVCIPRQMFPNVLSVSEQSDK